jgi:hypothetical protein
MKSRAALIKENSKLRTANRGLAKTITKLNHMELEFKAQLAELLRIEATSRRLLVEKPA